ncbi:MAG: signal recognition particle protein [Alphaproteobacteria bacterium]
MYKSLSERLSGIFDRLKGRGILSEKHVNTAMREIRIALLEADVALPVVKEFIEEAKAKAIGQELIRSINPAQMVIKIVNDQLVQALGGEPEPLNLNAPSPMVMLMVGLQGSGKTTSSAKLAKLINTRFRKNVLLASLDIYRPAAQLQLENLAKQMSIASLPIVEGEKPQEITKRAIAAAKVQNIDVIILDTAGRLHVDDELMDEVKQIKSISNPIETFLVADSLTGQDAVNIAKNFHEIVGVTGIILTRADGDARGGAALSMRHITGQPIKFLGMGEKVDQLEIFDPHRVASRILDMGDIVALVERAAALSDGEDQEKLAKKLEKGHFDLNDMAKQIEGMQKMGGLSSMLGFLPGIGKIKDKLEGAGVDDSLVRRQLAIIRSMTKLERRNPNVLNGSRRKRIANGSGVLVMDVNRLLKQFEQMQKMFKQMGKMGKKGFLRQGLNSMMRNR